MRTVLSLLFLSLVLCLALPARAATVGNPLPSRISSPDPDLAARVLRYALPQKPLAEASGMTRAITIRAFAQRPRS
jgi:hypothetical protein